MSISVKLFDYNPISVKNSFEEPGKDANEFVIQCFALNKKGKTYCIYIKNFKPFFYVKVKSNFTKKKKDALINMLFESMSDNEKTREYYRDSLTDCKIVKKNKLYGFDGGEKHKFVYLEFKNTILYNKFKNLWYVYDEETRVKHQVQVNFENEPIEIYEANIPPLLRFFHIKNISASGWIKINIKRITKSNRKTTSCDEEFDVDQKYIIPQNNKEDIVPYKVCSFDIEASSSHGDFPLPIKNYKKLADNLVEYWHYNSVSEEDAEIQKIHFRNCIMSAFGFHKQLNFIDVVYVKETRRPSKENVEKLIETLLKKPMKNLNKTEKAVKINHMCWDFDGEEEEKDYGSKFKSYLKIQTTLIDLLNDNKFKREDKLNEITDTLTITLPPLKGDKATFIGSTFWKYGEKANYYNNVIVLGECSPLDNIDVVSVKTERDLLLEWTNLIQRENPDIIIGYNIFGFDFKFLFDRACELHVEKNFLKLSKVKNEICGYNEKTGMCKLTESKINIASGTHDLKYITMSGRINIDMYNYFRREYSLESYKLDHVSSNFICDIINKYEYNGEYTNIYSKNLTGLLVGSYIKFEEIGHSSEYYNEGEKFNVTNVDYKNKIIEIKGNPKLDKSKILKWGLAKDDVTHHDIFRLTETGNPDDKAIVAKYCVQDCNLVHYLMNKIDVITGFVEMSNICSVPLDYLIMRGEGIKLYSFLAKKCRNKDTLIPDLNKKRGNEAYEGATVLKPKCGLYLDEPVACVDYSSLYPSSMISENISPDSKVWLKEYDLDGNLINETESKNKKYDNLPDYNYVDIKFDTYAYLPNQRGKDEKKHVGSKICRYAQFPKQQRGILPSILEELLFARKMTRKMAIFKNVTMNDGTSYDGLVNRSEEQTTITDKQGNVTIVESREIVDIKDTYDDFMKNVFDKRQLGYKLTANSIYGQTGAKTSSFYEPDVAASTTAIGRKLLYYGKRIIEEVYGDKICDTPYGKVHSHAEYIYGDTDSVFMSFKLTDLNGKPIVGKEALKITIGLAKEAGELATKFLKKPHDLEYEKTFLPFCLLSKKRYVGMLYEEDPEKCKRKSMGIVLKRRDNAPIVKDIYGGVVDILMEPIQEGQTEQSKIIKAMEFTRKCLQEIKDGKISDKKLIITKSLRSFYKNPLQIAHKVLADRMGMRDSGNKPSPGDRVPFMYFQTKCKVKLQGDRIEDPEYIKKNNLKPDYGFYITNQIMKPLIQVFSLVLHEMPEFQRKRRMFFNKLEILKDTMENEENYENKEAKLKNEEVKKILFEDTLRTLDNAKVGQKSIMSFFK